MTLSIALVLAILAIAVILFVKEWLPVDLVALLVLLALTVFGLITHSEALAGFSNPAIITIASVLVLSGGLMRSGVADLVGRYVLRVAGGNETRLLILMMATAGLLSGIMNDIGVAALLLPVVLDMARRTGLPPSKLLMPLSFSCLLGGLTTLIGTSPNILISGALADHGLSPFGLFDFTPVGLTALFVGIAYMAVFGRRLLPRRDLQSEARGYAREDLKGLYDLSKVLFVLSLPEDSPLSGRTLEESRLGSALGLNVLSISRAGKPLVAPRPDSLLLKGDVLLVEGRREQLEALRDWKNLVVEGEWWPEREELSAGALGVAELELASDSTLAGQTLAGSGFRQRFGLQIVAISRGERVYRTNFHRLSLEPGDCLLAAGPVSDLEAAAQGQEFSSLRFLGARQVARKYQLEGRLLRVRLPAGSRLAGRALSETRLGDAFGLTVLGISRKRRTEFMPAPDARLEEGDTLLLQGRATDVETLNALQKLKVDREAHPDIEDLQSDEAGVTEVMLSPRTSLAGKTLRELYFREKYGLTVLAIWREGKAYRDGLRDMEIRFGDALLVFGKRVHFELLAEEPDFLVLKMPGEKTFRRHKAPTAAAIEGAVLLAVLLGWLPIYIAAPLGAAGMILTGCLTMQEAYRFIEWKAVMLIAGMLALGRAMESSGAAALLADTAVGTVAEFGPLAVVAGLFLITCLAAQVMPTAAAAVLISPLALRSAADLGLSPYALMMVVALASSSAFLSPVGHPVNLLVMGVGGYRFGDYAKVGLGLSLLMLAIALVVLPVFWPLTG